MLIEKIQKLVDSEITSYQIGKATGLSVTVVQEFKKGNRKVENMTLKTAEKLLKYIDELEKSK